MPDPLRIPASHPALFFSPYNTSRQGGEAQWIYPGAYLKTEFRGSTAAIRLSAPELAGGGGKLAWRIDSTDWETGRISAGDAHLNLATGLPAGWHTLELVLAATDANYPRWPKPTQVVRVRALELAPDGAVRPPRLARRRLAVFGDSITEGAWNLGNSDRRIEGKWVDWVDHSDATRAWPRELLAALPAEVGVVGSGGMSWLRPSHSGLPPFPEAWAFHSPGQPREFDPPPDAILVNMGTNDGPRDTAPAVIQWMRDVRARLGPRPRIILVLPFGGQNREPLTQAVAAARADSRVHSIGLGPAHFANLSRYGHASSVSFDGLHPNAAANRQLGREVAAALRPILLKP